MMFMFAEKSGKCSSYDCTQKYVTTNLTMFAGVYYVPIDVSGGF